MPSNCPNDANPASLAALGQRQISSGAGSKLVAVSGDGAVGSTADCGAEGGNRDVVDRKKGGTSGARSTTTNSPFAKLQYARRRQSGEIHACALGGMTKRRVVFVGRCQTKTILSGVFPPGVGVVPVGVPTVALVGA
jgi:hypothetical protein